MFCAQHMFSLVGLQVVSPSLQYPLRYITLLIQQIPLCIYIYLHERLVFDKSNIYFILMISFMVFYFLVKKLICINLSVFFFCGSRGSNPESCIYYTLSLISFFFFHIYLYTLNHILLAKNLLR